MKICRYNDNRLGVVDGSDVVDVTGALDVLPVPRYPLPGYDLLIANLAEVRSEIEALSLTGKRTPIDAVKLLAPVANPGKILAAPVNYQRHFEEVIENEELHHGVTINPVEKAGVFLKATSALAGPSEQIVIRMPDRRNDHEVELVVIIGKAGSNIRAGDAAGFVAGYAVGLDITIRGAEERSLRKSPDGYAIVGPWFTTADEIADARALDLRLSVNGETRQAANTRDMILGPAELIAYASRFYTLYPGDILFTGTPEGVSRITAGDVIDAEVGGLGSMRVHVRP